MTYYLDECINPDAFNAIKDNEICFDREFENILVIANAVSNLKSIEADFAFFDLGLTDYDKQILDSLVIDTPNFYSNYGKLSILESDVTAFVKSLSVKGSNDHASAHVSSLIVKISSHILEAIGYDNALIDVRGFIGGSNSGYFPNWHLDKSVEEVIDIHKKLKTPSCANMFIFLLKGDTTLYHPSNHALRAQFNNLAKETAYTYGYDENLRYYVKGKGLDKIFSINNTYWPKFGEGSVHLTGKECGAIHSVPMSQERLFIRVFPSSIENIIAFQDAVKTQYKKFL
jgi:hypothetical protein